MRTSMGWTLYEGDCLEVMRGLPPESVRLVFADPPYNIGKADWDRIENYLAWCESWIAEASRILASSGAFWVSHSEPDVLVDISRMIERYGRKRVNWITWDKYNGNPTRQAMGGPMLGVTMQAGLRSFQQMAEYLVFHADEGEWMSQTDSVRGFIFEPLRAYLAEEFKKAGWNGDDLNRICGTASMAARHYAARSQWRLPTKEHYARLQVAAPPGILRREYEGLRREYEGLRYTFNNPGRVASVWQFGPAPRNGHPTPKPEPLLERIIRACTYEGDTILDPFAGSGTTLVVAERLGRPSIGIECNPCYCALIQRRMEEATQQGRLFA